MFILLEIFNIFKGFYCMGLLIASICRGYDPSTPWDTIGNDLVIPEGVTEIEHAAFIHHTHTTSVKLPSTLRRICTEAFYGTHLTEVHIHAGVLTVESNAFANCPKLTRLILEEASKVHGIRHDAFTRTPLEEVVIASVSYPVLTLEFSVKVYIEGGTAKLLCRHGHMVTSTSGPYSIPEIVSDFQKWFTAFMAMPTEDILDSSKLPAEDLPDEPVIKRLVALRLGGVL